MKKIIFSFIAVIFVSQLFAQMDETYELKIGSDAPLTEYPLQNLEGEQVTLNSLVKKNGIIVVFSCNTCPFVVGSDKFAGWEKTYNELAEFAEKNEIAFVLVNSNQAKRDDEDSFEAMRIHSEEQAYTMPYLMDDNSTFANAFTAKTTPHVFMMDGTMKVMYKGSIDNTWDSKRKVDIPYLKQAITQMVNGDDISFPETAPKGCSIKRI